MSSDCVPTSYLVTLFTIFSILPLVRLTEASSPAVPVVIRQAGHCAFAHGLGELRHATLDDET